MRVKFKRFLNIRHKSVGAFLCSLDGYMTRDVFSGLHNENHIFLIHEFLTIQATLFSYRFLNFLYLVAMCFHGLFFISFYIFFPNGTIVFGKE